MRIKQFHIYTYYLPVLQPLGIGKIFVTSRSGALIHIKTNTNIHGFGDASPLQGLHHESLKKVTNQLKKIKSLFVGTRCEEVFAILDNFRGKMNLYSSVQFALESAFLNINEQISPSGQDRILPESLHKTIYVNALVSGDDPDILKKIDNTISEKYRSIKIKVGRKPVDTEIRLLYNIRKIIGNKVSMRLDANQAWELKEAVKYIKSIKNLEIDYIEEPLKNLNNLPVLYEKTGIRIALDEHLIHISPEIIHTMKWINTLILKPSVIGSVRRSLHFINRAEELGLNVVISDTFHSGVGLSFLIRLASVLSKNLPMGFDTYRHLKNDILVNRLPLKNGHFDLDTVLRLCKRVGLSNLTKVESV